MFTTVLGLPYCGDREQGSLVQSSKGRTAVAAGIHAALSALLGVLILIIIRWANTLCGEVVGID